MLKSILRNIGCCGTVGIGLFLVGAMMTTSLYGEETLPPLKDGKAPETFEELWSGFDPRKEPLDVEILHEWEQEGVVLKVIRYRVGIFKGKKAMMAAVYGYPKGAKNLPGLVQIHGGGQYADYRAVLTNAERGYVTISIAWAGRISSPGYLVTPEIVKLFWEGKPTDSAYKLTTDWGVLDAYHAPCRNPKNHFGNIAPASWTLDDVESPRNNSWFLCTLAARRALTLLEQQPQVNPDKLGVYGHSMGAKITVMTAAADKRIKAAAPSCGGISNRKSGIDLYDRTIADDVNLKNISCPIIFLSPSNDFHGQIDDLQKGLEEIGTDQWRVTCSPHHNHQDTAEYGVTTQLWFDQYLKRNFKWPETPKTQLNLKTDNGIPCFSVRPDFSRRILSLDIFYTQHGKTDNEHLNISHNTNRFWHHAATKKSGNTWVADLSLTSVDKPLWFYANVLYSLEQPITGAGYYYGTYTTDRFNLSSLMSMVTPAQLKKAEVRATARLSLMIETFEGDWEKEWFTYKPENWARRTHKLYDEQWKAPDGAKLAIEIHSEQPNKMVVGIDKYAAEIKLDGQSKWQRVVLSPRDFHDIGGIALSSWDGIKELRLGEQETLWGKVDGKEKTVQLGADWQGKVPQFRNLRWIKNSDTSKAGADKIYHGPIEY